jgi:hypothetical protein
VLSIPVSKISIQLEALQATAESAPPQTREFTVARIVSPKPAQFFDGREEDYWHMVQDIAYRAGAALVVRDGESCLLFPDHEQRVCRPEDARRSWFETWKRLHDEFPLLSR